VSLRRVLLAFGTLLLVAGLVLGLVTGFFVRLGREGLSALSPPPAASAQPSRTSTGSGPSPATPGASSTEQTEPSAEPGPSQPPPPQVPDPVLKTAGSDQRADARRIRTLLATVDRTGVDGVIGAAVSDSTGRSVYATNAEQALIPASTLKLLTSAAALSLFGPHHRFTTRVVDQSPRQVVLVGGGDPYLTAKQPIGSQPARASLADLAVATATKLRLAGRRSVVVGYDETLFSGPAWNPLWPTKYSDQVGRTTALAVRPKDPDAARSAAGAFASALRAQGIAVATVSRAKATRGAPQLAAVPSMTVSQIVTQLLLISDNSAAEVMLRQIGLKAGRGGSIAGGRRALRAELVKLGVWTPRTVTQDGSGLARESRVQPEVLVKLLRRAAEPGQGTLRSLLTGLPVAGVEGSLRARFLDPTMHPADGVVRGKTGTLTGVRSLAGYLRTPDGTLLYYAMIINDTTDDYVAGEWIQRALTALSTCRCRA
jgi:serine-type D-Ala-D-Ala carboxypeptidase/endopeptidase (penicillin-binding protein 4)